MTDQRTVPNELLDTLGNAPLSQLILAWLARRDPATASQPAQRSAPQPGRRKGLDAIRGATLQAAPAIHVLILNDVPRTALTTKEVADITGMPYNRILREIRAGRIRVIPGGHQHTIPVTELIEINKWADYQDPLA